MISIAIKLVMSHRYSNEAESGLTHLGEEAMQVHRAGATVRMTKLSSVSVTALLAGVLFGGAAQAQPAPSSAVEEVIVTGSRIVRDGYSAPTPTTVVGAAEIQAAAP